MIVHHHHHHHNHHHHHHHPRHRHRHRHHHHHHHHDHDISIYIYVYLSKCGYIMIYLSFTIRITWLLFESTKNTFFFNQKISAWLVNKPHERGYETIDELGQSTPQKLW